jgi:trans-aconitate 2-methyltransferase
VREWDAETYHRISNPQFDWGMVVLGRHLLEGHELALDVGCGTGRLTEKLIERLPRGRVVGIDLSSNMLRGAREFLRTHERIRFVVADAGALPVRGRADAIFSTATFHWIAEHPRLFRSLFDALKPGGRLVAQCGGAGNLERIHERSSALMADAQFAGYFTTWKDPWEFANAETTERRLLDAGFEDVRATVETSPVVFPDAESFRTFITNVICRPHLAHLPETALREAFVGRLTEMAGGDSPPFELDYWRLNLDARRPPLRARARPAADAAASSNH